MHIAGVVGWWAELTHDVHGCLDTSETRGRLKDCAQDPGHTRHHELADATETFLGAQHDEPNSAVTQHLSAAVLDIDWSVWL